MWDLVRRHSLKWKLWDELTRASVLLALLCVWGYKSTSVSAGIHLWVQVVQYKLFSSMVFLPYFSMLTLSLPLFRPSSKSTSVSPGFCVSSPRQYDAISWELNLISWFFAFFWLVVWADGVNKCGWCLVGGSGYWLKGLHQITSEVEYLSFLTLSPLLDYLICTRNSLSIVLLL